MHEIVVVSAPFVTPCTSLQKAYSILVLVLALVHHAVRA